MSFSIATNPNTNGFLKVTNDSNLKKWTHNDGFEFYSKKEYFQAFPRFYYASEIEGNIESKYYLGVMFYEGEGVQVNYEKAFQYFTAVATNFNQFSHLRLKDVFSKLGDMYYHGKGVKQDYKSAFNWYTRGDNLGDESSKFGLGLLYFHGHEVVQNYNMAFYYFLNASKSLHVDAEYYLGLIYHHGYGDKLNRSLAFLSYAKVAQKNKRAAFNAGVLCLEGIEPGTHPDYKQAFSYFSLAAEQGVEDAMCNVGYFYECGYSVDRNYDAAIEWYKKAADAGSYQGMQNLGEMYMKGLGTKVRLDIALEYFMKAKEGGVTESSYYIQQIEKSMNGVLSNQVNPTGVNLEAFQTQVNYLHKKLETIQNEAKAEINAKDTKIQMLLEQLSEQSNQIKQLISDLTKK